jgi:hypothetical protein
MLRLITIFSLPFIAACGMADDTEYTLYRTGIDLSVKTLKFGLTYLSYQLIIIYNQKKYEEQKRTQKSDILNLITKINMKTKIKELNIIKKDDLTSFLNDKYGTIGEIVFILGWTIGGGEIKAEFMKELQLMGNKLGLLYKIAIDFENIELDILSAIRNSNNYVTVTTNEEYNDALVAHIRRELQLEGDRILQGREFGIFTQRNARNRCGSIVGVLWASCCARHLSNTHHSRFCLCRVVYAKSARNCALQH